jgi:hypothetical protein
MKFTASAVTLGLAAAARAQLSAIPIVEACAPLSVSCANAPIADQCREAPAIANALVASFFKFGIYSVNQMAAITSLMAFESLDFQYKRNQGAGNFGQGTANMQSAAFNLLYAKSIPELAPQFQQFSSADAMTPDDKEALLDALMPDEYNFGSGPWFLTTQCGQEVMNLLDSSPDAGFDAYMRCIVVPMDPIDPKRTAYWQNAKAAFGVQG